MDLQSKDAEQVMGQRDTKGMITICTIISHATSANKSAYIMLSITATVMNMDNKMVNVRYG